MTKQFDSLMTVLTQWHKDLSF